MMMTTMLMKWDCLPGVFAAALTCACALGFESVGVDVSHAALRLGGRRCTFWNQHSETNSFYVTYSLGFHIIWIIIGTFCRENNDTLSTTRLPVRTVSITGAWTLALSYLLLLFFCFVTLHLSTENIVYRPIYFWNICAERWSLCGIYSPLPAVASFASHFNT